MTRATERQLAGIQQLVETNNSPVGMTWDAIRPVLAALIDEVRSYRGLALTTEYIDCPLCTDGKRVLATFDLDTGQATIERVDRCTYCDGTGKLLNTRCPMCGNLVRLDSFILRQIGEEEP
jgi:hypothetical protein